MKISRKTAVKAAALIFVFYLLIYYWEKAEAFFGKLVGAFSPVILGFAIAYVLNILMSFYEKHYFPKNSSGKIVSKTRRPVCLLGAILTLVAIIALIVALIVPELVKCVSLLVAQIPPAIEKLLGTNFLNEIIPEETMTALLSVNWKEHIAGLVNVVTTGIGDAAVMLFSAITSVVTLIITVFLSIIFSVYLLMSKERLTGQLEKVAQHYIPEKYTKRIKHVLAVSDECFRRYIVGQCTEAVILGVLCAFGMVVIGIPYAGMIGALIGLTALIPIAGAYIGAGAGALMILSVSPVKALVFIIYIIVLQQIEGNLIYPKVVGKSIGLPAIYVLLAITVGGGLLGIGGMLLGVPVTSVIYNLIKEDINSKEEKICEKC